MTQSAGANLDQRFLYFAREATDRTIVEPLRNGMLLGLLEALDGALLLQEVASVLDLSLDRLEFVADGLRNAGHGLARIFTDFFFENIRGEFPEHGEQALNGDFGALE